MNSETNSISLGMILRDEKGEIHASSCCNLGNGLKLEIAKALAFRVAMTICDLELGNVLFERDCKRVVDTITFSKENSFELSPLIYEIKCLMQNNSFWVMKFAYRDTNAVAHCLAKLACSLSREMVWLIKKKEYGHM